MRPKKSLAARLFAKIHLPSTFTGCWEWTGHKMPKGYGQINRGPKGAGIEYAHRAMWELAFGPIPEGKHVCHRCDNPPCVRPDHLYLADNATNHRDAAVKGRAAKKLTPDIVREIRARVAGGERVTAVAAVFGVAHSTVGKVAAKETWSWLT